MPLPVLSLRRLLEGGVHFGHTCRRWNPKMKPYIFGKRNGIHIIDLEQSLPLFRQALTVLRDCAAQGGRILFVSTKRQAQDRVKQAAINCGQYYVNHRWLGGTITNWSTITKSIRRMKELEAQLTGEDTEGFTKRELTLLDRERAKLERALGGIREMGDLPDMLFVIDTTREHIAIQEAARKKIPVVGIIDSNADPEGITYPVPGNDDALRSIELYCQCAEEAVLDGLQASLSRRGIDAGALEKPKLEVVPESAGDAIPEAVPEAVVAAPAAPVAAAPEASAPE